MSFQLSAQDMADIGEIVRKIHYDLKFINMDYIYRRIEKLISEPTFKIYLASIKNDGEISEENEYVISDFEDNFVRILMCSVFIQHDLGDEQQDILDDFNKWLLEYSSRDSEKDGDFTKED